MPLFLKERHVDLVEFMDQSDCNQTLLFNTYQQFSTINRLISGWKRIYKRFIRPVFTDKTTEYSILDIGCGGGDILHWLDELSNDDGFRVNLTGIEPDKRAIDYLSKRNHPDNFHFLQSTSNELAEKNYTFDIVISNHLMHHLNQSDLLDVCNHAENLASKKIIFSDIERSDIGYALFRIFATPFFRNSFIVPDGLTSIKRSFRKPELQQALPDGWKVYRQFPFRLVAVYEFPSS